MNSFMLALSVVLPLVVYMTVGGLIRRFIFWLAIDV